MQLHVCGLYGFIIYNSILLLNGWQLPDQFPFVQTIYTNLHTKIFLLQYGKLKRTDFFEAKELTHKNICSSTRKIKKD